MLRILVNIWLPFSIVRSNPLKKAVWFLWSKNPDTGFLFSVHSGGQRKHQNREVTGNSTFINKDFFFPKLK